MAAVTNRGQQAAPPVGSGVWLATQTSATSPRAVPVNTSFVEIEGSTATTENYVLGTGWSEGQQVIVSTFATGTFNISPSTATGGNLSTATGPFTLDATGEMVAFVHARDNFVVTADNGFATATVAIFSTST